MSFEELDLIDWRFSNKKTNSYTHDFHPYPAKFIPQIPANIIKLFTDERDVVWDPFCGCGTAVVEAIRKNRKAVGTDLNPLATLMTYAKSNPIDSNLEKDIACHIKSVKKAHNFNESFEVPEIPRLDGWFSDNAIRELSIIKQKIENIENKDLRKFLKTGFSSIIVNVSYQDSNTRYTRVDNEMERGETIKKYESKLKRMIKGMNEFYENTPEGAKPNVFTQDLTEEFELDEPADLVVTSPPYPNAYDYHLYHKYRMFWLNMKPREMKHDEIGAHLVYQNRSKEENIKAFKENMSNCFDNIIRNLKSEGIIVMVIGDSKIDGEIVRNDKLFKNLLEDKPIELKKNFYRPIKSNKKSFNPSNSRAKREAIMVFKKVEE